MKTGSLFSAIGAAHLPGAKRCYRITSRAKGYKVTPVFWKLYRKAAKQIEEYFYKTRIKK